MILLNIYLKFLKANIQKTHFCYALNDNRFIKKEHLFFLKFMKIQSIDTNPNT